LHDSVIKADVLQSVPPNVADQRIGRVFDSTVKIMEEKLKVVLGLRCHDDGRKWSPIKAATKRSESETSAS
jgi:hypothetical protein